MPWDSSGTERCLRLLGHPGTETARLHTFYSSRDPDLLGHVMLYDPVMGSMNLIQALRLGIYHDELHYDVMDRLLSRYHQEHTDT